MMNETQKSPDKKTPANEVEAQNQQLAKALYLQDEASPHDDPKCELDQDIGTLERFLTQEGQHMVVQSRNLTETVDYKHCPICSQMPDVFMSFANNLQNALEYLDRMRDEGIDKNMILEVMRRERDWYLTSRNMAIMFFDQAHLPRNIINAHPDLHSLAAAKRIQNAKRSLRKKNRKNRKNRSHNR
jgi:chemotaxis response regulator CheB